MAGLTPDGFDRSELLSAYLDGELAPGEIEVVVETLTGDLDAIAEFHALQDVRSKLRLLPLIDMPLASQPFGHVDDGLSAYLDGELTSGQVRLVTDHLLACSRCRVDLRELDRARTAVRSLPGIDPPVFLIRDRPQHETARFSRRAKVGALVGAAAVAALFVSVISGDGSAEPIVTLDDLGNRHVARASAAPAFSVFPAVSTDTSP